MRLVLAGVAVAMAVAAPAPAQAALPAVPAPPVQQTVDTATTAARSSANAAVSAVQRQATTTTATVRNAAPRVEPPAPRATPALTDARRLPGPHAAVPSTPGVTRTAAPAPTVRVDTSAVEGTGREVGGYGKKLVQPLGDLPRVGAVDDAVALVGDALRQIAAPVGTLLAPARPLLTGLRDLGRFDFPGLAGAVSPGKAQTLGLTAEHGVPVPSPGRRLSSVPSAGAGVASPPENLQAASARPPAAEVGGRPVSPPPRTAPAPVAGGATALFSSGGIFVPFLGLVVLAALAAPKLMRRLDELAALVRPTPFLCALERPG